jgi:hypothetical protein
MHDNTVQNNSNKIQRPHRRGLSPSKWAANFQNKTQK